MRLNLLFVTASALSLLGCPKRAVIPDQSAPHQIAKATDVTVWCGVPDRKQAKCRVRAEAGWWLASPQAVEP